LRKGRIRPRGKKKAGPSLGWYKKIEKRKNKGRTRKNRQDRAKGEAVSGARSRPPNEISKKGGGAGYKCMKVCEEKNPSERESPRGSWSIPKGMKGGYMEH